MAGCPRERPIGKDDRMTTSTTSVEAVLAVFAAVEQRDNDALARVCQPDVEFCWPPSLPYGGTARGLAGRGGGWAAYWDWLQPTAALRQLDPRVVAAAGQEGVVLGRPRGPTPGGGGPAHPVVGPPPGAAGRPRPRPRVLF